MVILKIIGLCVFGVCWGSLLAATAADAAVSPQVAAIMAGIGASGFIVAAFIDYEV